MRRKNRRRWLGPRPKRAIISGTLTYYEAYVASLNPLLRLAMTGTGATEVNKGTVGATLDGTITTMGNQAIAGKIASDSAHLYDAATSVITVPNDASINALADYTLISIGNIFSLGESATGRIIEWPTAADNFIWRVTAANGLTITRNAATTDPISTGTFSQRFTGVWSAKFATYDSSTSKFRLLQYTAEAGLEEASYSAQTAASGAITTPNDTLRIGADGAGGSTYDGLKDELLDFGKVLPDAQMERIGRLALARRWNSYSQKVLEMA